MSNGTNLPFGDAYLFNTPYIDRLNQRLYAEEQQRKALRERENRMLDEEFSRNLSGIRDADIGELTKAYGDFKLARQGTIKRRGEASPEEQLEVLRKKAAVYDILNKSKQEKEYEENIAKQIPLDKKRIFADNAQQILLERRRTPFSKINRDNDKNLFYQYHVPDLAKELKTARGDERTVPITIGVSKVDPLKDDKEIYEVRNNPNQFAGSLLEQIVSGNKGRNFTGVMNNKYTDKELEDLTNKYEAKINDPKFIEIYGKVNPLPAQNTELGKAIAIRTMEEFANIDLKPAKTISEINADRQKKAMNAEWDRRNKITYGQALNKIYLNARLQGGGGKTINFDDIEISPDGNANITKKLQGINVNNTVTGRSFKSDLIVYNPSTKKITYRDLVDGVTYTVTPQNFRDIITSINTDQDLRFYDGLISEIDKAYSAPPPKPKSQQKPKTKINW